MVPSAEIKGKYKVVHAHNADKKIIYRIMIGADADHRQFLMKKVARRTPLG
jgi:hypothetical protein